MKAPPPDAIFHQLTQAFAASQNFSRQEVWRRQVALLERIVRHARVHAPYTHVTIVDRIENAMKTGKAYEMFLSELPDG